MNAMRTLATIAVLAPLVLAPPIVPAAGTDDIEMTKECDTYFRERAAAGAPVLAVLQEESAAGMSAVEWAQCRTAVLVAIDNAYREQQRTKNEKRRKLAEEKQAACVADAGAWTWINKKAGWGTCHIPSEDERNCVANGGRWKHGYGYCSGG